MATGTSDLPALLGGVLDVAITLTEADFGNIQLLDSDGHLGIVVHRGFPDWWIEYWNTVTAEHGVCGSSLALGERVLVEDVEQSPIFAGTPALDIQRKAGIRAVQSTPLRGRSGQVLGMLSTHYRTPRRPDAKALKVLDLLAEHATTLIERRNVEGLLRTSETRLDFLLSSSPVVIYTCQAQPPYAATFISGNAKELMGIAPEQFTQDPNFWADHIHPDDRHRVFEGLHALFEHGTHQHEYRFRMPDGSYHWMCDQANAVYSDSREPVELIGYWIDITERKHAEAEAQRHSELMQTLARQQVAVQTAAAFAHELNQPLVSIAAYNEVALRALSSGKEKTDQLARAIEGSHAQALRAGRVLHDLMDHLHKGDPEPGQFDINELVKNVILKIRVARHGAFEATLDLEPSLPAVLGNSLQTEKVLLNLIQNGIEAMEEAGVVPASFAIAVRTLAGRKMAHVTVRDSGPGVDADTARRIFEPFFSTKPSGFGLGLAISRSLIEAQNGQLWLDPEDGPGAVFHFTLPFAHE